MMMRLLLVIAFAAVAAGAGKTKNAAKTKTYPKKCKNSDIKKVPGYLPGDGLKADDTKPNGEVQVAKCDLPKYFYAPPTADTTLTMDALRLSCSALGQHAPVWNAVQGNYGICKKKCDIGDPAENGYVIEKVNDAAAPSPVPQYYEDGQKIGGVSCAKDRYRKGEEPKAEYTCTNSEFAGLFKCQVFCNPKQFSKHAKFHKDKLEEGTHEFNCTAPYYSENDHEDIKCRADGTFNTTDRHCRQGCKGSQFHDTLFKGKESEKKYTFKQKTPNEEVVRAGESWLIECKKDGKKQDVKVMCATKDGDGYTNYGTWSNAETKKHCLGAKDEPAPEPPTTTPKSVDEANNKNAATSIRTTTTCFLCLSRNSVIIAGSVLYRLLW